jgi:hypothetical protein
MQNVVFIPVGRRNAVPCHVEKAPGESTKGPLTIQLVSNRRDMILGRRWTPASLRVTVYIYVTLRGEIAREPCPGNCSS